MAGDPDHNQQAPRPVEATDATSTRRPARERRDASEYGGVVLSVFTRWCGWATFSGSCGSGLTDGGIEYVEMPVGRVRGRIRARPVPEGDRSVC